MQHRYLKMLIYFCVWMGLNILWVLRSISYLTVDSTMLVGKSIALHFAPIVGITVLLLMTLFKWRPLNLVALIWLVLATITARPPIYLLSVGMFGGILVLICDVYLTVIICNHDQPVKYVNQIAVILGIAFFLCLLSPKLSAQFASSGYSDPVTATKTEITVTKKNTNQLKTNNVTRITPRHPKIYLNGVGDINLKIRRIGIFYFSYADYVYKW
ncbi:Hypothetical protein ADU70_1450 [Pediococcus damnosus]|uniref:Uncharacterized protein n=1 Tax=Pediococcus damnosus TaxID=51663 RepID=A0AAC9B285_9LACO|nr:Hypothetical protein ADU70_1450 [Pediococcus damnosus]